MWLEWRWWIKFNRCNGKRTWTLLLFSRFFQFFPFSSPHLFIALWINCKLKTRCNLMMMNVYQCVSSVDLVSVLKWINGIILQSANLYIVRVRENVFLVIMEKRKISIKTNTNTLKRKRKIFKKVNWTLIKE